MGREGHDMTKIDPAFTRWVQAQHALGRSDADIDAMFASLAANTADAAGDPARQAQLEADLKQVGAAQAQALADKLGVPGTPQASSGQAVAAWLATGNGAIDARVSAAAAGATSGTATAAPEPPVTPEFRRWVDEQHALGRSDADIAAGFEHLGADQAAAAGDPAAQAQLDANLATLADQSNAAYLDKLGVKTNNGRQGVSPTAVVDAYLANGGGVVGQAVKVATDDRAYRYGAPTPTPTTTSGSGEPTRKPQAAAPSASSPSLGSAAEDARLVRQATEAKRASEAAAKAAVTGMFQSSGRPTTAGPSFTFGGATFEPKPTSIVPLPNGGSQQRYAPILDRVALDSPKGVYDVTFQPFWTRDGAGKVTSGARVVSVTKVA
ncbi:MAG: hypothetical protein JWM98_3191 [Thermoleophilia bacterium]|nr:hypothetical protein [Thermoleophilia bacterium]